MNSSNNRNIGVHMGTAATVVWSYHVMSGSLRLESMLRDVHVEAQDTYNRVLPADEERAAKLVDRGDRGVHRRDPRQLTGRVGESP